MAICVVSYYLLAMQNAAKSTALYARWNEKVATLRDDKGACAIREGNLALLWKVFRHDLVVRSIQDYGRGLRIASRGRGLAGCGSPQSGHVLAAAS